MFFQTCGDVRSGRWRVVVASAVIVATGIQFATAGGPVVATGSSASVSLYLSEPGVEGPFLAGSTLESFSTWDTVNGLTPTVLSPTTALGIGSVSAGSMKAAYTDVGASRTDSAVVSWSRGAGSAIGWVDANGSVTIDLSSPRNYFGLLWLAGDVTNTVVLRSAGTEVARFSTRDIIALVPKTAGTVTAIGGATYTKTDYYGSRFRANSSCGAACNEPYAFIHFVSPVATTFNQVQFLQGAGGGFEFDNLTVATYSGSFDTTGLVGVPVDQLVDDSYTVDVNETLSNNVRTNDTILTGSTFAKYSDPSLGSVTVNSDGSFNFVAGGTAGETSFQYRVCRASPSTTCVTATVTITINGTTPPTDGTVPPFDGITPPDIDWPDTELPDAGLPDTGQESRAPVVLGVALLAVGAVLLAVRRRFGVVR